MSTNRAFCILIRAALSILLAQIVSSPALAQPCFGPNADQYLVGAAQDDITGPLVGIGMLGYANLQQVSTGLHMRLRSRALVIRSGCQEAPVAMVIADLGLIFAGLRSRVLQRVEAELPGVFHSETIMLSASHTHSSPGGYADHALYNFTTWGFESENFETIAEGIAQSVIKAYRRLQPRSLSLHRDHLRGLQFNRSLTAYNRNPEEERKLYSENTDSEMILLNVKDPNGQSRASFNWFPLHGVSLSMENRLISGDNKGLAAYLVERKFGSRYQSDEDYIAGFVQSHSGDVSPYSVSPESGEPGDHGFQRNEEAGRAQGQHAEALLEGVGRPLRGPIRAIERWVDLRHYAIKEEFTNSGPQSTCEGVLGVGFAAGSENGQPLKLFSEGTIYGIDWPRLTFFPKEQKCQSEKVMLIPSGMMFPAWTANVAAFQIFQIGTLGIVAAPFEMTTMAGRRLRKAMEIALKSDGIETVVISALANEYLHYVTTREEYSQQDYEGGATLFGPWSLAAYTQIFTELADALSSLNRTRSNPPVMSLPRFKTPRLPRWDTHPSGAEFGSLKRPPRESYQRGDAIEVEFWAAKPSHTRKESYLRVQREKVNAKEEFAGLPGQWETLYYDWDPNTRLVWQNAGLTESTMTVIWNSRRDDPSGRYRICLEGESETPFAPSRRYQGCTKGFRLEKESASVSVD